MNKIPSYEEVPIFSLAIVVSEFNQAITEKLYQGALERLKELNFPDKKITVVKVPGAVEIPVTAQQLAKAGLFEAIICLGAVIFGETDHYAYVCEQVSQGCQRVALDYDIPVIFGVLTTRTEAQALDRVGGGSKGHYGKEAVEAALKMVTVVHEIHDL